MNPEIRMRRLRAEHERLKEFQKRSRRFEFTAFGDPPERYTVTLRCLGMINEVERAAEHVAKIYMPAGFPKDPPKVSFLTPCFHPNIVAAVQVPMFQEEVNRALANVNSEEERKQVLEDLKANEKIWEAHVCLDSLDYNWVPEITLDEVVIELAELIQYKRYNVADPLNGAAARWASQNKRLLPIDHRDLLDVGNMDSVEIRILPDEDVPSAAESVTIRILS